MRKLLLASTALVALALFAPPASATFFHHPWHSHRAYGGYSTGGQAQGVWSDLAMALLPGLLNQFHIQLPPGLNLGNLGGQSGASTPIPTDAAKTLNEIGPQLDDILTRSRKLLPEKVESRPK
jgi:hypothetical protein